MLLQTQYLVRTAQEERFPFVHGWGHFSLWEQEYEVVVADREAESGLQSREGVVKHLKGHWDLISPSHLHML